GRTPQFQNSHDFPRSSITMLFRSSTAMTRTGSRASLLEGALTVLVLAAGCMIHESGTWEACVTGRTLLHYNILEKLGEGGMGVVWKARDTHLDRFVAVKVLPAEKLMDAERKRRFVQEAKAASALNHPNIVHIYDIAEADVTPFIAMEYVVGKT